MNAIADGLIREALVRIEKNDPAYRSILGCLDQNALARQLESIKSLDHRGPLYGQPIAVKDNICTREGVTCACSKMLAHYSSPYDAHVVEKLRDAGAVIVAKTNCDEFAMGSSTENSAFGVTRNPWNLDYVPGGSSGGSAVAVAARLVPYALGSDTGGSIRQPAALSGITGLKPTYGRVSRYGLIAFASSLDQIGPMAVDVMGVAQLLTIIAGHDARDSTSVDLSVPDYVEELVKPLSAVRIGVPREYFGEGLDSEVRLAVTTAIDDYRKLGAEVRDISLPHTAYTIPCYYLVATAEASSNLARFDGVRYGHRTADPDDYIDMYRSSRAEGFGPEVKLRIMLGTYALSAGYHDAYYLKALKVRTLIKKDFLDAFTHCDVILSPTSPTPAFRIGERSSDPLAMYLADVYTTAANLAGIPAISLPCGFTASGLPIGMQLMASHFEESRLLRIAHAYQKVTEHHLKVPPSAAS